MGGGRRHGTSTHEDVEEYRVYNKYTPIEDVHFMEGRDDERNKIYFAFATENVVDEDGMLHIKTKMILKKDWFVVRDPVQDEAGWTRHPENNRWCTVDRKKNKIVYLADWRIANPSKRAWSFEDIREPYTIKQQWRRGEVLTTNGKFMTEDEWIEERRRRRKEKEDEEDRKRKIREKEEEEARQRKKEKEQEQDKKRTRRPRDDDHERRDRRTPTSSKVPQPRRREPSRNNMHDTPSRSSRPPTDPKPSQPPRIHVSHHSPSAKYLGIATVADRNYVWYEFQEYNGDIFKEKFHVDGSIPLYKDEYRVLDSDCKYRSRR